MNLLYRLLALLLLTPFCLTAQNKQGNELHIKKISGQIVLDGELNEPEWQEAQVAGDFYQNYPVDSVKARTETHVRVLFNDDFLYMSFQCFDDGKPYIIQSLRRDFDYEGNDNVGVTICPFNDYTNGYFFVTTPYGAQMEGTIAAGGARDDDYSATWDNKWYSAVKRYPDQWIAEWAIPFKSFRYRSDVSQWNLNFIRMDVKGNTRSSWIATPVQFDPASFAWSGNLFWDDQPPSGGANISLIPYMAGGISQDNEAEPAVKDDDFQVGIDAKIGITPSLNLDLTVNPDFSQVEVDRQVINLTRFEYRFPERRQFFLENNDMIDRAGFPEARPFFSRRVGLAKDTSDNLQKVPILYGARLSGKISKDWRVNILNMQTREKLELGLPNQNYTVAAVQKQLWERSNITFLFVDKESFGVSDGDSATYFNESLWKEKVEGSDTTWAKNVYNRVATVDLDLNSKDNRWQASFYYSHSFDDFHDNYRQTGGIFMNYRLRNIEFFAGRTWIQKNYNAEAGFVPANGVYPGINSTFGRINGNFFPKNASLIRMGPRADIDFSSLPDGTTTDKGLGVGYYFTFQNTMSIEVGYRYTYQKLTEDFNPIDDEEFDSYLAGSEFSWNAVGLEFQTDQRKVINGEIEASYGGFYSGNNLNVNGNVNCRYQPFGSLGVQFDFNDVRLPDNYGKEKLFVIGPRLDITFTDKLFLTTFVQYNNLADNMNLNTRFQWRFKPASDFFIVYTENYLPQNLVNKNRALVFKFTYWLNL